MKDRPGISPAVVAELTGAVPKRLIRKLDKDPAMAERWTWQPSDEGWTVTTDRGEQVRLGTNQGSVERSEAVECSCLLSPRCIHVLAVVSRLAVADGPPPTADNGVAEARGSRPASRVELDGSGRRAARALFETASQILDVGALAAGAMLQAELLRGVHQCRAEGLHRPGRAGLRLLRSIRDLRDDRPELSLDDLARSLHEVLQVTWAIQESGSEGLEPTWLGVARRAYREVGGLRLYGLLVEPVIAASGYAGVVSYLVDDQGSLLVISDVLPAESGRSSSAYGASISIGEATASHRDLCRGGLVLQRATASDDGRLGSGSGVKAASARGVGWDEPPLAALWSRDLSEQLDRVWRSAALPLEERRAGWDLLFLRGEISGVVDAALMVDVDEKDENKGGVTIRCEPGSQAGNLCFVENHRRLARAVGLSLRLVGRVLLDRPRSLQLLAISPTRSTDPESGGAALRLPPEWGNRINLGLDPLFGSALSIADRLEESGGPPQKCFAPPPDPTLPLRRRLHRMALGGRATISASIIDGDQRRLIEAMMPTGAAILGELSEAASSSARTTEGRRVGPSPSNLARAWVRGMIYQRAAIRSLQRAAWLF